MADGTTPRSFWPVTVAGLLWNAFGLFDFVMTNARAPDYVAQIPAETMQYIDAMPYWTLGAWMAGVGFAVLGSLLLLARSHFAVPAFAVSLIGLAANTGYQLASGQPLAPVTAAVWIGALGLLWYAARMRLRGVLR